MKRLLLLLFVAGLAGVSPAAQTQQSSDDWKPLKFLIGKWEGTSNGHPGAAKVTRQYQFVLNNKYIQVRNTSTYDPQPKNPKGEVHQDWGMISYDKSRNQFVFRQFHVEGFVNQYISSTSTPKTIVFTSESIENIPAGFRARETYEVLNENEFTEKFELAEPGKEFVVYSEGRFKRKS